MQEFIFNTDLYYPSETMVWTLMSMYTLGVVVLPSTVRQKSFDPWVRYFSMAQNLFFSGFSAIMLGHLVYYALHGSSMIGLELTMCGEYMIHFDVEMLRFWTWVFYCTKYIEWLDTLWLILKHKPISTLHFFHHLTVVYFFHFLLIRDATFIWMAAVINTFVHTIMYYYFFYAECAKYTPLVSHALWNPKPFKQFITWMQIRQFYIDIVLGLLVAFGVPYCRNRLMVYFAYIGWLSGAMLTGAVIGFPMVLIYLFNTYYKAQYKHQDVFTAVNDPSTNPTS